MSELDVIRAVLGPLRTSLAASSAPLRAGGPVYTQRTGPGGLQASNPTPPYFLLSPGPAPAAATPFDTPGQFFLEGWGTWTQLDEAFARISWLHEHQAAKQGQAARIRYALVGAPRGKEPETTMPDGREMHHWTNTYRALYVDLTRFAGPAVSPQARPP